MITLSLPRYIVDQFDSRYAAVRTIVTAASQGDRVKVKKPDTETHDEWRKVDKKVRCQAYISSEVEDAYRERARSLGIGLTELAMRTVCYIGEIPDPVHRWADIPEDRSMLLTDEPDPPTYEECIEILKRKGMA